MPSLRNGPPSASTALCAQGLGGWGSRVSGGHCRPAGKSPQHGCGWILRPFMRVTGGYAALIVSVDSAQLVIPPEVDVPPPQAWMLALVVRAGVTADSSQVLPPPDDIPPPQVCWVWLELLKLSGSSHAISPPPFVPTPQLHMIVTVVQTDAASGSSQEMTPPEPCIPPPQACVIVLAAWAEVTSGAAQEVTPPPPIPKPLQVWMVAPATRAGARSDSAHVKPPDPCAPPPQA